MKQPLASPLGSRRGFSTTHQQSSTVFYLLLSLVVWSDLLAFARGQSSCSTRQVISTPNATINPGAIQGSTDVNSYEICDSITVPLSTLPSGAGFWFSYTPRETKIIRLVMESLENDSFSYPPDILVFKGSCDSLTCEAEPFLEKVHFQGEAGVEYLIYIFRTYESLSAFQFTLDEIEPPINDNIENPIPLTQQDLPYRGDFTTDGALSDFNDDACGLDGEYGVWFTYTTPFYQEYLTLQVTTGFTSDVIGIQSRTAGGFVCDYIGSSFAADLEWVASADVIYYILVGIPSPDSRGLFEFRLQSRSYLESGPTTSPPSPAPVSNSDATSDPPSLPVDNGADLVEDEEVAEEEQAASAAKDFPIPELSGARLALVIFLFLILA